MDDSLPGPCVLLADRGHKAERARKTGQPRDAVVVIPMRRPRKPRVAVGRKHYRLRNLVKRGFNTLKTVRPVATHHDITAEGHLGFRDVTPVRPWIRRSSAWPSARGFRTGSPARRCVGRWPAISGAPPRCGRHPPRWRWWVSRPASGRPVPRLAALLLASRSGANPEGPGLPPLRAGNR
ncbi:MAG: transposase [Alphaproteobacteria bacterium]|nr:transposase [Alphaproteobacteria bacterium]